MGKALAKRIKCTILYGTETGKSETFAKRLCQIFKHAFDAKVIKSFFINSCLMSNIAFEKKVILLLSFSYYFKQSDKE